MRRAIFAGAVIGCPLALLLGCYWPVLFGGEQFAYRDAAHFYYPLYLRIQREWDAGRWPLWDPWQNAGQPLLASPMSAVLYPGKVVYAALPYAWGARLYVVGHTALAFVGLAALARSLGLSWVGACLGGMSYAFGGPVLLQYGNVIYLVGAAWLPWGLRATDRLVRLGRGPAAAELAVVLAMQVLGGDPQAAYLTVACGVGYAAWLARAGAPGSSGTTLRAGLVASAGLVAWAVAALGLAYARSEVPGWYGSTWLPAVLAWGGAACWVARRRRRDPDDRLAPRLAGLAGASGLAVALSAAQLIPTAEFAALSTRAGTVNAVQRDLASLEPHRLAELAWPAVFGRQLPENRHWMEAVLPERGWMPWAASIYVGGLPLLLGLAAAGLRRGPAWRAWFTLVAAVSLLASLGRFGGPLWWARFLPPVAAAVGPHDPPYGLDRVDGWLVDGAGSVYALLVAGLPGFGLFRFPAKLLTLASASAAVLAAAGWDDLMAGRSRWLARGAAASAVASAVAWALAAALRGPAVAWLDGRLLADAMSGPADAAGAWAETVRSLAQGTVVYAVVLGVALRGPRRPHRAGAVALLALAIDLGLSGSRLIWTVPQSLFDAPSEVARRIEAAERADPSPGPFRIHRMSAWFPERFLHRRSPDRVAELVAWQRATLVPQHQLPPGLEACLSMGGLELRDYQEFTSWLSIPASDRVARDLGVEAGSPIGYHPRRSYDLSGARYFILPVRAKGWADGNRGYAAFLAETELLHPRPDRLGDESDRLRWEEGQDWQLRRNRAAYPRAWIVHHARIRPPATDLEARADLLRDITFQDDPILKGIDRPVYDLRATAWIETDDRAALRGYLSREPVGSGERVTVVRHDPQRVELRARLDRPGLVILADAYYPGWRLTIDGRPAPILRANRVMRGAAVRAGEHTLVYEYVPWSFRAGLAVSALGWLGLVGRLVPGVLGPGASPRPGLGAGG